MKNNNDIIQDDFLYPGCICEVWDDGSQHIAQLRYFKKVSGAGNLVFSIAKDLSDSEVWKNYKPIGTPWDFAPKDTTEISIDEKGYCITKGYKINFMKDLIIAFPWNDCPDYLKGKTLQRPQ